MSDLEDVRRLAELGLAGAAIGRAIYEQSLDLGEALRVARAADAGP